MKLSSTEEYGLRCLVRLGMEGDGGSLTIPEISRAEGVSEAYAAKVMRLLRRGGFVKSARGKIGGYTLERPPEHIVIAEVIEVLGGRLFRHDFCSRHSGLTANCTHTVDCSLRGLWESVQFAVDRVLSRTTLKDLLGRQAPLISLSPSDERRAVSEPRTAIP